MTIALCFMCGFLLIVGGGFLSEHGRSDAERGIGSLAMLAGVCVFLVGIALMLSAAVDVLAP